MHIVLVSCCEKKAIKRTRAVLDSYARRTGDRTWLTPITTEGMVELRKALRKNATRQTSVACFRNDGMKRMRLLWIVGNSKNFDKHGTSPVATTQKKSKYFMPGWAKICSLIAETAGFMHDLGKANNEFQDKLIGKRPPKDRDNVRHEWLSMFLSDDLLKGKTWEEASQALTNKKPKFSDANSKEETLIFKNHLSSLEHVLLYCIATHHKLPSKESSHITEAAHVNLKKGIPFINPTILSPPSEVLFRYFQCNFKKIKEQEALLTQNDPAYFRAIATISRMALILADQTISDEIQKRSDSPDEHTIYANTKSDKLNQTLDWHLKNVGFKASEMLFYMLNIPLPSLSQDTVDQINQLTRDDKYAWQNVVSSVLSSSRAKNDVPHLVLNMASTGSGKTRMNLRAICALNPDKPVRVVTALNLRTLTLQTGDAYQKQLGIGQDEMACVIGDSLAQKLHASGAENVDEDEDEYGLDVTGDFECAMPDWLKFYAKKNPKLNDIIGAPILVSTIDFLVAAGEPDRKHHHILAAMRIMHSDLILDEIDGYEPKALLSVLRLVTMAALFGKNVVASSATLSKPVAKMLWQAYAHGAHMRGLLQKETSPFVTAVTDDTERPLIATYENEDAFMQGYEAHVKKMMKKLEGKNYRVPVLAEIETKDEKTWLECIKNHALALHQNHAWQDEKTNKNISIGLVRIANIKTAIEVSRYLAKQIAHAKIVCYHANHFPMQRFHIEKRLDELLTRKESSHAHICNDTEMRKIIDTSTDKDVQFIVVATPVEEIGRDHDFDWAVIEPSSSQSIVQTAGRVNRHRLKLMSKPNVALLQYCYREIKGKEKVFIYPGLETDGVSNTKEGDRSTHLSHDLKALFSWNEIRQIDAKMRFCDELHDFAKYDNHAIERESKEILNAMLTKNNLWMAKETYTESSLRSLNPTFELSLDLDNHGQYKITLPDEKTAKMIKLDNNCRAPIENAWLIKTDEELIEDAKARDVPIDRAMTLSISCYSKENMAIAALENKIHRDMSFGFYYGNELN